MGDKKQNELLGFLHKSLQRLKLVDINLQVEAARIYQNNGVRVIAEEIKEIIGDMEAKVEEFEGGS